MNDRIPRRWLELYAAIMTLLIGALGMAGWQRADQRQRFEEIEVERINVIEPDGRLRMVISNRARSTGPIYQGEPFGYPGGGRPGIIFFNDEETENGGLTFHGHRRPDGSFQAGHHLSFDQFEQDQIVVLNYTDDNGTKRMGLTIGERANVNIFDLVAERDSLRRLPEGPAREEALRRWAEPRDGVPLYAPRVYVGRDARRNAVIDLYDPMGRPRLRLRVDSLGIPALEFLEDNGDVTVRLPDPGR